MTTTPSITANPSINAQPPSVEMRARSVVLAPVVLAPVVLVAVVLAAAVIGRAMSCPMRASTQVVTEVTTGLRSEASAECRVDCERAQRCVPPVHLIDIDTADVAELALLPEIGPVLAAQIVGNRAVLGAFGSIDALGRVPGIGPATIRAISPVARASSGDKSVRVRDAAVTPERQRTP